MAVYNEIGIGRWNRFIQKLTDMKGGPPARQLSSEIQFSHNIFHGTENRYLEQWDRYGSVLTRAAVAAQTSDIRLRNPAGSNVIAVIEQVTVSNLNATAFQFFGENGVAATDLAGVGALTNARLDARGRPTPTCIASTANNGAGLGGAWNVGVCAVNNTLNLLFDENQELPLLPGDAYQISTVSVNVISWVSWVWRERFLEPAERF